MMADRAAQILADDKSIPGAQPDDSFYAAWDLVSTVAYGNAITAVLQLRIPNILAKAEAEGKKALAVEEILEQLPTKSKPGFNSSSNLSRLLRTSLRYGLLKESLNDQKQVAYSLTNISRWFVKDKACNLLDRADLELSGEFQSGFHYLSDLILDESIVPFNKSYKTSLFQNIQEDGNFKDVFHRAMTGVSNVEFAGFFDGLRQCGALNDVNVCVDVGGGVGTAVAEIVARNPNIQGINFDRPDVIAMSPKQEGVEHVGGNFFESIPSGDLMFIKHTIHNYGDEDAIRILRNCFQALPKKGKVIIAESVLKDWKDTSLRARIGDGMDLLMLMVLKGARERTEVDFTRILETAGFSRVSVIELPGCLDLVQAFKE